MDRSQKMNTMLSKANKHGDDGLNQWAGSRNAMHVPQEATPKIMEKTVMSTKVGFQYGGATDAFMRSGDISTKSRNQSELRGG